MKVKASAPSNIALIKYMGKDAGNQALNSSLSYTLEHLRTFVEVERDDNLLVDEWGPLLGLEPIELTEKGRFKFLTFWKALKSAFEIQGHYQIRSANNFPSDCGLASSASSFAALTLAAYDLAKLARPEFELTHEGLAEISRLGSGSSCRSFFTPWALWDKSGARKLDLPMTLEHAVVIVESAAKTVSSSEAHERIQSSLNWQGRVERASQRLERLQRAIYQENWREIFELTWSEFFDMHALFETSQPSFGYFKPGTLEVLWKMREIWKREGDGPVVTMDAGANVHLLIRSDQRAKADLWLDDLRAIRSWS